MERGRGGARERGSARVCTIVSRSLLTRAHAQGLGNMFSGGAGAASGPVNEDNLRPEDILKAMM